MFDNVNIIIVVVVVVWQYVVYGVDDGAIFVNARAQFSKQPGE